jgi:hypothetical protein
MQSGTAEQWREQQLAAWNARHKEPGLVLTQEEVGALLVGMATGDASWECPDGPDCNACNRANRIWWELMNALGSREYQAVLHTLVKCGIELPPIPWYTVDPLTGEQVEDPE